ncbi:MAG: hypothetical protein JXB00_17930 [Bacteroidales bacterium]|nr:hypothetical protein [Bacteroidales bacterium]
MKKIGYSIIAVLIFCGIEPYYEDPIPYRPVVMTRETLEQSVSLVEAMPLKKPGKIYVKDKYLFINEKFKGIHIINNADSTNPVNSAFLRIPGCIDMAVKGNILYADNAVDLVAIDLSDPANIVVTKRIKNAFTEICPPGYDYIPWMFSSENRPKNTIIIEWEEI